MKLSSVVIPPSIIEAKKHSVADDQLLQIEACEESIHELEKSLRHKKADLVALAEKRRKELKLSHRDNSVWCLEIDQDNPYYFLKTSKGVAFCTAYKNSIVADADLKSKIASALSWLYLNEQVGRIDYNGTRYYGVTKHFTKDDKGLYSIIKPEMEMQLKNLKQVNK